MTEVYAVPWLVRQVQGAVSVRVRGTHLQHPWCATLAPSAAGSPPRVPSAATPSPVVLGFSLPPARSSRSPGLAVSLAPLREWGRPLSDAIEVHSTAKVARNTLDLVEYPAVLKLNNLRTGVGTRARASACVYCCCNHNEYHFGSTSSAVRSWPRCLSSRSLQRHTYPIL